MLCTDFLPFYYLYIYSLYIGYTILEDELKLKRPVKIGDGHRGERHYSNDGRNLIESSHEGLAPLRVGRDGFLYGALSSSLYRASADISVSLFYV